MSLSESTPTLSLSDIMHHMTPSPVPPADRNLEPGPSDTTKERAGSPEPLTENDVQSIKHRLQEMGVWSSRRHAAPDRSLDPTANISNLSSREKELVEMVESNLGATLVFF